jgi:hypothetical protein
MQQPAVGLHLGEPEHDAEDAGTYERRPEPVQAAGVGAPGSAAEQMCGKAEPDDGDGNVDEEDPPPRGVVDDESTDDRPEDRAQENRDADERQHAAGLLRTRALRHQREADGDQHPAAEALEDPAADQLADRRREPTQRRPGTEETDRDEPDPLGSEALVHPPRERDDNRQRQQIGGRDPLHRGQRGAEVSRQPVQRHVDDRGVERGHHEADGDDRADDERLTVEAEVVGRRGGAADGHSPHPSTPASAGRSSNNCRRSRESRP